MSEIAVPGLQARVRYDGGAGPNSIIIGLLIAALLGGAAGLFGLPVLGAAVLVSAGVAVWSRPQLAAYSFLLLMPFLAGMERGRFIPAARPSEALLVFLGLVLLARFLVVEAPSRGLAIRASRLDGAILVLAFASSVLPVLWLLARGLPLTQDDLFSTLAIWKLYAVYLLIRSSVKSERHIKTALAVSLGAAAVVSCVALLQSFDIGGMTGLLEKYWAAADTGDGERRATATFGSSIATADYLAYSLAIALTWMLRIRAGALVIAASGLLLVGALAAAQFSGFIALIVIGAVVGAATGTFRRLLLAAIPVGVLGVAILWTPITTRISGFSSEFGVPRSWLGRWDNLTNFYLPELGDFNFVLGVRPNQVLQAPETWREVIFLESGHLWLLWVGGIPLLLAFAFFTVRAMKTMAAIGRERGGFVGVAGIAALAALGSMAVLMILDAHLTLRGAGDLSFALLGLAMSYAVISRQERPSADPSCPEGPQPAPAGPPGGKRVLTPVAGAPQPARTRSLRVSFARRLFDIALASSILALLAPLLLAIAALIRLTNPGPALFRQERLGHHKRPFTLLKFRTMAVAGNDSAHRELATRQLLDPDATPDTTDGLFKLEDDPRVTAVGKWLRRYSLDEIPQLINVVRGEMSIIGPRPALAFEVDLYQPEHHARFDVLPGLTGLWQTSGRNRLSMIEMLDLDCRYVSERSWLVDLRILAKTPWVLVRGDGAR